MLVTGLSELRKPLSSADSVVRRRLAVDSADISDSRVVLTGPRISGGDIAGQKVAAKMNIRGGSL